MLFPLTLTILRNVRYFCCLREQVPERDVHRVVHSLLGSQTNLSDFVSSMAYNNQSGQSWSRGRRGNGVGTVRSRMHRGRQTQGRRGLAARAGGQRGDGQRNSVNVSFRGSEWESMRVWPQSIDFQAGFGDNFQYDSLEDQHQHSDGFRFHYSSAHRSVSRTLSEDEESGAGRDEALLECEDDSYLSGNQTMLAEDGHLGDHGYHESVFDGNYSGGTMGDEEDWDEPEGDCNDEQLTYDELPLGRIAGKRKYTEMCNIPTIPHRCAPRSRSMAPADMYVTEPGENGCSQPEDQSSATTGRDIFEANQHSIEWETEDSQHQAFMYSTNLSSSLGSQPCGAMPDSAETVCPLTAFECDDASGAIRDVCLAPVCHFELPPSRGEEVTVPATAASRSRASVFHTRAAHRDRAPEDTQGSQCASHQAAIASGDPLAVAEMHVIDSAMSSLSLHTQSRDSLASERDSSSAKPVQVMQGGRAVYKTKPEPILLEPQAPLDMPSPGSFSVWSQRNTLEKHSPAVKKNQCCIVM